MPCSTSASSGRNLIARARLFGSPVLPEAADAYFRLERVALNGEATHRQRI
jgi:hypothetical protein